MDFHRRLTDSAAGTMCKNAILNFRRRHATLQTAAPDMMRPCLETVQQAGVTRMEEDNTSRQSLVKLASVGMILVISYSNTDLQPKLFPVFNDSSRSAAFQSTDRCMSLLAALPLPPPGAIVAGEDGIPDAGDMVTMIAVRELPPRDDCSKRVSLLSLKGM